MGSVTFGFIDPSGNNWTDGYKYNNITIGQVVTAQAHVDSNASQITVEWSFGVSPAYGGIAGFSNYSPNGVNLSINGKTKELYRLVNHVLFGCSDPVAPQNASGSYTLTDTELSDAKTAGFIQLSMWGCPGTGIEIYSITAYTIQTIPHSALYTGVDVTVENPVSSPITGVAVILKAAGGGQFSATTNSSGVAAFSGVKVGTYQIKVTYNPFADVDQGITVSTSQTSFTVQMKCPSGGKYQLGVCVPGGIPGQIVTTLEIAGVAAGGVLLTYGVAKTLPKTVPAVRRHYEHAKQLPEKIRSRVHR